MVTDQWESAGTSTARLAGLGAAGAWLIFWIVVSVSTAVVIFSATQFQTRLSSFALNGAALSVWKADQLREQWSASLKALAAAQAEFEQGRTRLEKQRQELDELAKAVLDTGDEGNERLSELAARVSRIDPDLGSKVRTASFADVPGLVFAQIDVLKQKDPDIESSVSRFIDARSQWYKVDNNIKVATDRKTKLEENQKKKEDDLATLRKETRLDLTTADDAKIPPEQEARIENAIYEFQAIYDNFPMSYYVARAPSDLLVLILVIAMGVLGSSLQLGYVYTAEFSRKPISFYIFRPFLGVVTALVIFIVVKAGIPLIADTNRVSENVPINPYFISFLGIISGFMSERALVSLRQLGTTYFKDVGGDDTPRWARSGIRELFSSAGRDPHTLQQILGVDTSELDDWLDGKKQMPRNAQMMFSAILDKPVRDLFSDLPPEI